jgi:hypothetical protein
MEYDNNLLMAIIAGQSTLHIWTQRYQDSLYWGRSYYEGITQLDLRVKPKVKAYCPDSKAFSGVTTE